MDVKKQKAEFLWKRIKEITYRRQFINETKINRFLHKTEKNLNKYLKNNESNNDRRNVYLKKVVKHL